MKKLNEDLTPELISKQAEGQARLAKHDADIAALNQQIARIQQNSGVPELQQQIAKIEQEKSKIETELAKVTGQSAQEDPNKDQQQQDANSDLAQQTADATVAAQGQAQATSESLLVEVNDGQIDEYERLQLEIDQISDQMVYLSDKGAPEKMDELQRYLNRLVDQQRDLERGPMGEPWDSNEFGSHIRGMREEEEARYSGMGSYDYTDKRNWYQKPENRKQEPAPPKERKPREKRMTKREYEKELKDVMSSLKADIGDYDHSIVFDLAENLFYNGMLKDYVVRRWQKEQMSEFPWRDKEMMKYEEPDKHEIIEIITNDLEMSESYNPMSKTSFYDMSEAYVDDETVDRDEDAFVEDPYLFYIKAEEDTEVFIAKIYKISPDGDWFGKIIDGDSDTFEKISYQPDYDEDDIVDFLSDTYEDVEIVDSAYAEGMLDDVGEDDYEDDEDEDLEESWPMNTI